MSISGVPSSIESASTAPKISDSNITTDGRLAANFRTAVTTTTEKYFDSFKFSLFQKTYPEIYKESPADLKHIYDQLKVQLKTSIQKDIDELCQEVALLPSYNSLEALIKNDADKVDKESWRPSGCPEEDTRDHLYQLKQKHKKCLEFHLETSRKQNAELEAKLFENHKEIMDIKKSIDQKNKQMKDSLECLCQDSTTKELEGAICTMLQETQPSLVQTAHAPI